MVSPPCVPMPAEVRGQRMVHSRRRPGDLRSVCSFSPTIRRGDERQRSDPATSEATRTRIQEIVNDFMARLTLTQKVAISVVPKNPLMLSVEFDDTDTGFLLSLEEDFVDELTDEELRAAIAHELGHVWIFTHHPYLQTEVAGQPDRAAAGAARQPGPGVREGLESPGHQGRSRPLRRQLTTRNLSPLPPVTLIEIRETGGRERRRPRRAVPD